MNFDKTKISSDEAYEKLADNRSARVTPVPTPEINSLVLSLFDKRSIPVFILPIPPVITTILLILLLGNNWSLIFDKYFRKE